MATDLLREFLVGLGFKIDEEGYKKFRGAVASTTAEVTNLGLKTIGASAAVAAGITKIAEQYEALYFSSVRTGSAAASLQTFAYGSRAIGISAEQSAASLEKMNLEMLANPGKVALLNMLGIKTAGRDTKEVYNDLIKTLASMPRYLAFQYGAQFGMSPSELNQRIILREKEAEAEEKYAQKLAMSGVNVKELADKSWAYNQALHSLGSSIDLVWDQTANKWLPSMTSTVKWLGEIADYAVRAGKSTDGWSSSIISMTAALGGLKAFSWLLRFLPGGAAAAGAAATGAVATAGIAALGAVAAVGALVVPTNESEEPDLYKRNKQTGKMELTPQGQKGLGAASAPAAASSEKGSDRDLLIRTVIGEAGNQSAAGKEAVADVVVNRLKSGRFGGSMQSVLFAPKQFEPWQTRSNELMSIDSSSKQYQEVAAIVDKVLAGKEDITKGATHFANVDTVEGRNNSKALKWIRDMQDNGSSTQIGDHLFGRPDSQPGAKAVTVTNNITINGATDPHKTGEVVRRELATNAEQVRNAGVNFK